MTYLERVRRDAGWCGGAVTDAGTNWASHPQAYAYQHFANAVEYKAAWDQGFEDVAPVEIQRYSCDAPHPQHYDTDRLQVHLERLGPFHGTGDGDWSRFLGYDFKDEGGDYKDRLVMREQLRAHKDVHVRGSFAAIVDEDGNFFGYPPLHMHHLHLHPYHDNHATMHLHPYHDN